MYLEAENARLTATLEHLERRTGETVEYLGGHIIADRVDIELSQHEHVRLHPVVTWSATTNEHGTLCLVGRTRGPGDNLTLSQYIVPGRLNYHDQIRQLAALHDEILKQLANLYRKGKP